MNWKLVKFNTENPRNKLIIYIIQTEIRTVINSSFISLLLLNNTEFRLTFKLIFSEI